jgi:hypothetical protein
VRCPQLKIGIEMKDYKNTPRYSTESPIEAVAAFIFFVGAMVALYVVLAMVSGASS